MQKHKYYVYILKCSDGTYYTGITNDLDKRVEAHNTSPQGAKYTRTRRPVRLMYSESCTDKGEALRREYEIRKCSRTQKVNIIATFQKKRA
ncbi:GIY-YIG nuclease family protein [Candidatus Kaiserbacteria bacterium]|nr:GIY-YIG nuclease family protein [Candidatus Kaiserbacteria bacterium]